MDAGRYEFSVAGESNKRVSFKLIADECVVRRMIVDWQQLGAGSRSQGCARSADQTNAGREIALAS